MDGNLGLKSPGMTQLYVERLTGQDIIIYKRRSGIKSSGITYMTKQNHSNSWIITGMLVKLHCFISDHEIGLIMTTTSTTILTPSCLSSLLDAFIF